MPRHLEVAVEQWPIAGNFTISRGARTEATVVVVQIRDDSATGRGESVPYARYGETVDGVVAAIESLAGPVADGIDRAALQDHLPPGAARNAIDCALWDLEARTDGRSAAAIAGLPPLRPVETAFTLSLASPAAMATAARTASHRPLLKVKLGAGDGDDPARIAAVREAAPGARLIVDANEGWSPADYDANIAACAAAGVALIEQPLPAGADGLLADAARPVPLCADESLHTAADIAGLAARYDAVNIKLDKAGGLTEALITAGAAREHGLAIMVGCMVATSLAMAPALLLAQSADYVDLDGPLLLVRDRVPGLAYRNSLILPPGPGLWG